MMLTAYSNRTRTGNLKVKFIYSSNDVPHCNKQYNHKQRQDVDLINIAKNLPNDKITVIIKSSFAG